MEKLIWSDYTPDLVSNNYYLNPRMSEVPLAHV
jgi:hypothetical protein